MDELGRPAASKIGLEAMGPGPGPGRPIPMASGMCLPDHSSPTLPVPLGPLHACSVAGSQAVEVYLATAVVDLRVVCIPTMTGQKCLYG